MNVYIPYDDQRKQNDSITIQSMGIQLGINVGAAAFVMVIFNLLRSASIFLNFYINLFICNGIL
jgi:hypothetical protein